MDEFLVPIFLLANPPPLPPCALSDENTVQQWSRRVKHGWQSYTTTIETLTALVLAHPRYSSSSGGGDGDALYDPDGQAATSIPTFAGIDPDSLRSYVLSYIVTSNLLQEERAKDTDIAEEHAQQLQRILLSIRGLLKSSRRLTPLTDPTQYHRILPYSETLVFLDDAEADLIKRFIKGLDDGAAATTASLSAVVTDVIDALPMLREALRREGVPPTFLGPTAVYYAALHTSSLWRDAVLAAGIPSESQLLGFF